MTYWDPGLFTCYSLKDLAAPSLLSIFSIYLIMHIICEVIYLLNIRFLFGDLVIGCNVASLLIDFNVMTVMIIGLSLSGWKSTSSISLCKVETL